MSPQSRVKERIPVVNRFVLKHGRAPTLDELCGLFNVRSKNTASVMAAKFVEAGVLGRTTTGRLTAPRQNPACKLRILGSVAAGFPSPAEESLLDTLSLDEYLVTRPEATFMLKVEGDSMIDAGILPGDTVLVERGRTPRNGDIVIACVDSAWTMKYFFKDGKGIRLEPANKKYETIRPKSRLAVEGVVSGVIRKLV
ncbi:MAG: transcriptional repressor LexA [Kiritimatiellia bacterium]|jgi:repressor LexA|nr:transcriptional repressor LexA [Kiritimatiellia bacterium]